MFGRGIHSSSEVKLLTKGNLYQHEMQTGLESLCPGLELLWAAEWGLSQTAWQMYTKQQRVHFVIKIKYS